LEDRQGSAGTSANEGREGGREGGRESGIGGERRIFLPKREGYKYKHISYDKTHMLKKLPRIKECMQNTETWGGRVTLQGSWS